MDIQKTWKKISWSAIFAGALTGFGINFLLNLVTLAFGVSIFSLTTHGKMAFSLGGFFLFGLIAIFTMFMTGIIAGRLSPPLFIKQAWGILIGFIAWSLLLILTIVILTNMVQFTAFHSNFTSHPRLVAIRITNDLPMMTETRENKSNLPLDINIEKTTKIITLNATVTFILFLMGALASGFGGYVGYGYSQKYAKRMQHP